MPKLELKGFDRMASAWLIRRLIDKDANLQFADMDKYSHIDGNLCFDVSGGEFSHEDGKCTFEVLCKKFSLNDPSLIPLAQIIHDLDKDKLYQHSNTELVKKELQEVMKNAACDHERLSMASEFFDAQLRKY
jgi:hypothetical protein